MGVMMPTILLVLFTFLLTALQAGAATGATLAIAPQLVSTPTRPPRPSPTPTVDAARLATGKALYLANYCGICHTLAAAGTTGVFGPSHEHIGRIATQRIVAASYTGAAKTAADYIRESIVAPAAYFAPGANARHPMPPYAHLSNADIDALVYFLLRQQ